MAFRTIGDLTVSHSTHGVASDEYLFVVGVEHKHRDGLRQLSVEQARDLHYALGRAIDQIEKEVADYNRGRGR